MNSIRHDLRDCIRNYTRNSFDGDIDGKLGMTIWNGTGSIIEKQVWKDITLNVSINIKNKLKHFKNISV